jgi:hypothetical protein
LLLLQSGLNDFIERTIEIAPAEGFNLDVAPLYQIYITYCKAIDAKPSPYSVFLTGCRTALPYAYRERVTAYKGAGVIITLAGVTYKQPAPWKLLKKGFKYYIEKSAPGSIDKMNQMLSAGVKPLGIPEYWPDFARLSRIRSGNKIVIFSPYDYQVRLWALVEEKSRISIVKSRQLGITQLIVSIFLHRAALNEAYVAVIFLKSKKDTSKISERNRAMVKSMGGIIKGDGDSKDYFKVLGGGYVHYMNAALDGARSMDSISDSLFDEAGFSPNIESLIGATAAASAMVGDDATQIVVSTPNTKHDWFYRRMSTGNPKDFDLEAVCKSLVAQEQPPFITWEDENNGAKAIIHWRAHPIYGARNDFVEYRRKLEETSEETAEREYNLAFVNSAVTIFPYALVAAGMIGHYESEPDPSTNYYMGIDTAGIGIDYTVAKVGKEYTVPCDIGDRQIFLKGYSIVDEYRKSGELHNIDLLGITALIRKWRPKRIGIECFDGTGEVMRQSLIAVFPDIDIVALRMNDGMKMVVAKTVKVGLEEGRIIYPQGSLSNQLSVYALIDGKMQAPSGYHDDDVSALFQMIAITPFSDGDYRLVAQPYVEEDDANLQLLAEALVEEDDRYDDDGVEFVEFDENGIEVEAGLESLEEP